MSAKNSVPKTGKAAKKTKMARIATPVAKITRPAAKIMRPAAKKAPQKKKNADVSAKKLSALAAAACVLGETKQPMSCPELIAAMADRGYWTSPHGKTPAATLSGGQRLKLATRETVGKVNTCPQKPRVFEGFFLPFSISLGSFPLKNQNQD